MHGDPYTLTASYAGSCGQCGSPFEAGTAAYYYPRTKTLLTGPCAAQAMRDFAAAAADDDFTGAA